MTDLDGITANAHLARATASEIVRLAHTIRLKNKSDQVRLKSLAEGLAKELDRLNDCVESALMNVPPSQALIDENAQLVLQIGDLKHQADIGMAERAVEERPLQLHFTIANATFHVGAK